jgi:hypothetical protein
MEMGHIPVGMEMFSAADEEQWKIIARQIDDMDYYVVIIAHRYGSVTREGISYTEKEYDYAVKQGIPVLGFLLEDKAPWPANKFEKDSDSGKSLEAFKKKVRKKPIGSWTDKNDLYGKVSIALMKMMHTTPRIGWVKVNEVAGPEVMKELTRLSSENAELRRNIEALKNEANRKQLANMSEAAKILGANKTQISIWKNDMKWWSDPIEIDLFTIFIAVAPELVAEASANALALRIAVNFAKPTDTRPEWPVPQNTMSDILCDLANLDLVEPSTKKHPIGDKNTYWVLTILGRQLLKVFRLQQLNPKKKPL